MQLKALAGGPLETLGYFVCDHARGYGLVVDTPLGSTKRFLGEVAAAGVELVYIVNTHGHWDHIADNVPLREATGAALCAHSWDATRLANPQLAIEDTPALPVVPSKADRGLQDGDLLEVGELCFTVIHTPGHTPGSICLYEPNEGILFTGDTLYRMGVGRTNFPGANLRELTRSLQRLADLPDSTRVYPGHGRDTTIRNERWLFDIGR